MHTLYIYPSYYYKKEGCLCQAGYKGKCAVLIMKKTDTKLNYSMNVGFSIKICRIPKKSGHRPHIISTKYPAHKKGGGTIYN
jgi:hypothetical protein